MAFPTNSKKRFIAAIISSTSFLKTILILIFDSFLQDFRAILVPLLTILSKSVAVIKNITICPSVKKKTLPKIILIQSEDTKFLAKKVLQLLPSVIITNLNISISRQLVQRKSFKVEFKGIKGPTGEFKGIKEPKGGFKRVKGYPERVKEVKGSKGKTKGVKEPPGYQNIPCPSRRSVVYMNTDTYEVIHHVPDKNSVAFFRQTPIYHSENCLIENKPCCKSKTKCKTKEELKTFVKLKIRGRKLQLATGTSNDIQRINVGQYCKCQS